MPIWVWVALAAALLALLVSLPHGFRRRRPSPQSAAPPPPPSPAPPPPQEPSLDLAPVQGLLDRARHLSDSAPMGEAARAFEQALAAADALLAAHPSTRAAVRLRAEVAAAYADLLDYIPDWPRAQPLHQAAVEALEGLSEADPGDAGLNALLIEVAATAGETFAKNGEAWVAGGMFEAAVEAAARLPEGAEHPRPLRWAMARAQLGHAGQLYAELDPVGSQAAFEAAIAQFGGLLAGAPDPDDAELDLAGAYCAYADRLLSSDEPGAALDKFTRAQEGFARVLARSPNDGTALAGTARARAGAGEALLVGGHAAEAHVALAEAVRFAERRFELRPNLTADRAVAIYQARWSDMALAAGDATTGVSALRAAAERAATVAARAPDDASLAQEAARLAERSAGLTAPT